MVASVKGVVRPARSLLARIDRYQQRHAPLAVTVAVVRKFGDDQAGNLAALLAYYGFFSLFPLLLVLVTALDFVLAGNPELQSKVLASALAQFPVIGDQLRGNIGSVQGSGLALAVGLLGTLWAGLSITQQAQNAMNVIWGVPRKRWPGLGPRLARGFTILAVLGAGTLATTALSGVGAGGGLPVVGWVLPFLGSLLLNLALFQFAFMVLTTQRPPWRRLLPGTALAAVGWSVLQVLGGWYVTHQLRSASQVYGTLAFVIVLLSWLYLGAQLFLYAAELNVVLAKRLWPRSLLPPPLTEGDKRTLTDLAMTEERRPEERVDVDFAPREPSQDGGDRAQPSDERPQR
jgi:YihY family inner membrane protein